MKQTLPIIHTLFQTGLQLNLPIYFLNKVWLIILSPFLILHFEHRFRLPHIIWHFGNWILFKRRRYVRYLLVVGNWLARLEVVVVTGEDLALGHDALCLVYFLNILFAHYLGDGGVLAWIQAFTWSQMQLFLLSIVLEKVSSVVHQVLMIENIRPVYLDTHLALFIIIQNRRLPHFLYFSVPDLLLKFFHFSLQLELVISECSYMISHKFWLFIERVIVVLYGFLVSLQFHTLLLELLVGFPKWLHFCFELHYPQRQFLHLLHWLRVTQVGLF